MTVVEFNHYSVMLHETIEQLNIRPDGIYVDGTLGGGGHAYEVCSRLQNGHFYGIDQDDAAIAAASERLRCFGDKVTVIRNNYVIPRTEGFLTDLMHRLTCGWIADRP